MELKFFMCTYIIYLHIFHEKNFQKSKKIFFQFFTLPNFAHPWQAQKKLVARTKVCVGVGWGRGIQRHARHLQVRVNISVRFPCKMISPYLQFALRFLYFSKKYRIFNKLLAWFYGFYFNSSVSVLELENEICFCLVLTYDEWMSTFSDVTQMLRLMGGRQEREKTGRSYFGFNEAYGEEIHRARLLYSWSKGFTEYR